MNALARWRQVLVVLSLLAPVPAVQAQSYVGTTFEKIREYGAIYVGFREASIPFSYLVGNEVMGYSKDLCDRIIDAIKVQLDEPKLKVVLVPTYSISRVAMLRTGVIDLECGSTTNTKIRQQSVAFSVTTFVSGIRALVRKDVSIDRIADLNGKVVVTTTGTTTEYVVRTVLAARNGSARAKSGRTHLQSFNMVLARQADAFVMDDAILSGLLANSPDGDKFKILEDNFGYEPYGIVMRRDDPDLKKLVDDTLIAMMKNGELEKLYNKWFMSPIPPNNVNLQIPMSNMLKDLIRNPSDAGI
jgi:glutamate/aspartate transport system substrate-binding protein